MKGIRKKRLIDYANLYLSFVGDERSELYEEAMDRLYLEMDAKSQRIANELASCLDKINFSK